jgi:hypothetical protein
LFLSSSSPISTTVPPGQSAGFVRCSVLAPDITLAVIGSPSHAARTTKDESMNLRSILPPPTHLRRALVLAALVLSPPAVADDDSPGEIGAYIEIYLPPPKPPEAETPPPVEATPPQTDAGASQAPQPQQPPPEPQTPPVAPPAAPVAPTPALGQHAEVTLVRLTGWGWSKRQAREALDRVVVQLVAQGMPRDRIEVVTETQRGRPRVRVDVVRVTEVPDAVPDTK